MCIEFFLLVLDSEQNLWLPECLIVYACIIVSGFEFEFDLVVDLDWFLINLVR